MLGSLCLESLLAQLPEFADLVLFDTPALAGLTDAALFAAKLDGVVLVADSGSTRRDDLRSARDLLERLHAHLLGVVLNHAEAEAGPLRRLFGRS